MSLLECTYCHGKNHTKDRCYKLIGYPVDPSNRGKKKPFTKSAPYSSGQASNSQTTVVSSQALQVSTDHSTLQNSSNIAMQMETLQNQMNTLFKLANSSSGFNSQTGTSQTGTSQTGTSFQFGTNFAGTVLSLMAASNISSHV